MSATSLLLLTLCLLPQDQGAKPAASDFDVLILGGSVHDGSGAKASQRDVNSGVLGAKHEAFKINEPDRAGHEKPCFRGNVYGIWTRRFRLPRQQLLRSARTARVSPCVRRLSVDAHAAPP